MGKNGKKVKSDRINAVRKQYDAFLEEDRKRKDRNEYILERLDKMRSCSALVPVRHTQTNNIFDNLRTSPSYEKTHMYPRRIIPHEKPNYVSDQFHNSSTLTTLDEEAVIKELSKKYILIPKHQPSMHFEYKYPTKSSVEDVNDWRSKYSILEELKKGEKEEDDRFALNKDTLTNKTHFTDDNINEEHLNDQTDNQEFIIKTDNNVLKEKECLQKFPKQHEPALNTDAEDINVQSLEIEKELFYTKDLIKNIPTVQKNSENEASEFTSNIEDIDQSIDDLTEKEKLQAKYEMECKPEIEEQHVEEMHNKQNPSAEIGWQEEIELSPTPDFEEHKEINELPIQSKIDHDNEKKKVNSNAVDVHNDDYSTEIEQNRKSEINCETKTIDAEMLNAPNNYQTQSNEHDAQAVTNEEIIDDTTVFNNQDMQQEVTENTDHQIEVPHEQYPDHQTISQQDYEETVDQTQIQGFETEQNNMFYPEQTEDYTYADQANIVDNTTVEYANNEGYEQNENYAYYQQTPNNQVYPNDYQETPQSQDYSNEINEHEESTEQYDPNYQNQYENYSQENPQPETVQEYTADEYDTQQKFDQDQYDESNYNVVEEVQQHLDDEEGYTKPMEAMEGNLHDNVPKNEIPENPVIEQEVKVTS